MKSTIVLAGMCLGLAANVALADTTIKMDQQVRGRSMTSTLRISDGVIRMDSGAREGYTLFKTDRQAMIHVNPAEEAYIVIDRKTMHQMGQRMQKAMERMKAALAKMPPQQRERVRRMMKQRMGGMMGAMMNDKPAPEPEITRTGNTKTVNGYTCEIVRIESTRISGTVCLTPREELNIPESDYQTMLAMQKMAREMAESMLGSTQQKHVWLDGGVPMAYSQTMGNISVSGSVTSISTEALSDSLFTVPEGFEKRTMPGMKR